jgi:MFS family permease
MQFSIETMAYITCLMCVFVDVIGQHFTSPVRATHTNPIVPSLAGQVLVPYGQLLGATTSQIGLVVTINMFGRIISNQLLPWLSDKTSRKLTIILSIVGSGCGYTLCGAAYYTEQDSEARTHQDGSTIDSMQQIGTGFTVFLGGKLVGGLFGGQPPCTAVQSANQSVSQSANQSVAQNL